jgi:hypothetical protein
MMRPSRPFLPGSMGDRTVRIHNVSAFRNRTSVDCRGPETLFYRTRHSFLDTGAAVGYGIVHMHTKGTSLHVPTL